MGRISAETINELNNRLDAVAVVGDYVKLEKKSGRWWGRCPFHSEKTPSFTVDPERKTYYCFGCHEGGGIVNFVMEMDKLSFPEAVEILAKRFGVPVMRENTGGIVNTGELDKKKDDLSTLYHRVAGSFSYILMETPEAKAALRYVRGRGITDEFIQRFRLGYAPADPFWLRQFLINKGYSEPFLDESGLFTKANPRRAFFSDRLIFPIAGRQGQIVAFGGRILNSDGPKYINSAESLIYKKRETLFAIDLAINEIKSSKEVIIAEGYMDVIALHQAGVCNSVAPLGTAFTVEQAKLLGRWADRIKLLFDNDTAGQTAAAKGILTCRSASIPAFVIRPEGAPESVAEFKDPADILKEKGAGYLQQFVKHGIIDFEYLLAESRRSSGNSDSMGKARAVASLFPFLDLIDSEVERESYFRQIAEALETGIRPILNDYKVWHSGGTVTIHKNTEAPVKRSIRMNDEIYLLNAVAVNCGTNPSLFAKLRSAIPIEEFTDSYAKELYIALEECSRAGNLNFEAILNGLETGELKQFVAEKAATREFSEKPECIVADSIRRVKEECLTRKRDDIVLKMRAAKNDGLSVDDLIHEKMFIDAELQSLKGVNKW
ncbi:MAG: DNA primase [Spirochaetaceae bacterium]|jgi:DNA primase|nr:DNA primase [Spirochaetaceae bacterium]